MAALDQLPPEHRLELLKYVCAFAWADATVTAEERRFVHRLIERLELDDADRAQVETWLEMAPPPHSVVASNIPKEHAQTFVEAVRAVIYVDGNVDPEEQENFDRLVLAIKSV